MVKKLFSSDFVPAILFKQDYFPSPPALSLIFNLSNFEGQTDGWKDSYLIRKTNKKLPSFLKFTGSQNNIYPYLKELEGAGIVKSSSKLFKDSRKRPHEKKVFCLAYSQTVFLRLFDLFQTLNALHIKRAEGVDFIKEFERTDFYKRDPVTSIRAMFDWYNRQEKFYQVKIKENKNNFDEAVKRLNENAVRKTFSKKIKDYLKEPKNIKRRIRK